MVSKQNDCFKKIKIIETNIVLNLISNKVTFEPQNNLVIQSKY